ncbi:cryptochrome DASH, chloroplastic/mitochondrial [Vigna unguiculata]|uniref:cryptochrome DASH, chloroplastic/mitochondrial n=1 Tax=Vigna unguiculata TaxID=3917 RepID=UPI0010168EE0|nr:cryptochrome DASH, chloroplastic/mitochondrial [Vigna unguiculata]
MAILHCTPLPFLSLRSTLYSSKCTLTSTLTHPTATKTRNPLFLAMNTLAKSEPVSSSGSSSSTYEVPELDANDMDRVAENTFRRYTWNTKRSGKGTAIVWFRNDLRVLDNEALYKAWLSSETVLPVYCVDPRLFATTYHFGFPKTGALRAQFLLECLVDLRKNLMKKGLNLLVQQGKPEEILPSLAKAFQAHTVYAQKETCSEEVNVERLVMEGLKQVGTSSEESSGVTVSKNILKLQLVWGTTMYHLDDLPFDATSLPDMYTQFRKIIEAKCTIRSCIKLPPSLGPPPLIEDWGCLPSLEQLGLGSQNVIKGMKFVGGETAGLSRVYEYFWKKDFLKVYKETRNGMLGPDYSTKFSPWLASGSLSPRFIYEEVKRYENERLANSSTYWVLFELIWRDYFRFLSVKYGNSLFHLGGPRKVHRNWSQDKNLFESWRDGCTGYPLVDANMKELSTTGFMSNRGRQIVCSFLVRDMGIDWRMGAEWFETCLLDYDPCSNYGNWTYGSGVGNDPREDRYFSIPKQAQTYDPEGEYVAYWLPQLRKIEKEKRNFPGNMYIPQIVPLKFGTMSGNNNYRSRGARRINDKGNERKWNRR